MTEPVLFATAPVADWPGVDLVQCFAYAVDPRDGKEYVFIVRADQIRGNVGENTLFHRHLLTGSTLKYLDTMRAVGFGHLQSVHVRISAKGNAWIWSGVDQVAGKSIVGKKLGRYRFRTGTITRKSTDFAYIPTGPGNWVDAVSAPAWQVVLRRASSKTDTFELHQETDLMAGRVKAVRKFTRTKVGGTYQGSAADATGVDVAAGKTLQRASIRRYDWGGKQLTTHDLTKARPAKGIVTSREVEGPGRIRGRRAFMMRFNSIRRRAIGIFWTDGGR